MGLAVHDFRRNAVYVWRRRLPASIEAAGSIQVSLRTRDPEIARLVAPVVTAKSPEFFSGIIEGRLTPIEARRSFEGIVAEQIDRLRALLVSSHKEVSEPTEREARYDRRVEGSHVVGEDVIATACKATVSEEQCSSVMPYGLGSRPSTLFSDILDPCS